MRRSLFTFFSLATAASAIEIGSDTSIHFSERELQSADQICKVIMASGTVQPSCTCGQVSPASSDVQVVCNNYCNLCVNPPEEMCVSYSYALTYTRWNATRIGVKAARYAEKQTGRDSSNSELVRGIQFNQQLKPLTCATNINGVACNSCTLTVTPNECYSHDCTNLPNLVGSVINTCAMPPIPLQNPLVTLRGDILDIKKCPRGTVPSPVAPPVASVPAPVAPVPAPVAPVVPAPVAPVPAPVAPVPAPTVPSGTFIPPKKKIRSDLDDNKKDDAKLFVSGYTRGDLGRRRVLKGR